MIGFKNTGSQNGGSSTPLGKIMLRDVNGTLFTTQAGAKAYIQQFTNATITDESFDEFLNAYYFNVPAGTSFDLSTDFCSSNTGGQELQFIDEYGLIVYMLGSAFYQNSSNNYLKNVFFDGNSCFYQSSGSNVLQNIQVNGNDFFRSSAGNNTLKSIVVIGDMFFQNAYGSNLIENGNITSLSAFSSSAGNNILKSCEIKGDYSFQSSRGINTFEATSFANFNFANSSGINIFYKYAYFQASCFYQATSNNFFYGNVTAGVSFFYMAQDGNNYFYKDLTVGNSGFTNAKSNNFINKIVSAGNNLFRVAAPKNKNEIVELVSCGNDAFRDYVGSIYFSILGEDNTQNLPADIFTVTTICCVNFNFSLKAYNDGDYVQMVANIGLNPAQHLINLF